MMDSSAQIVAISPVLFHVLSWSSGVVALTMVGLLGQIRWMCKRMLETHVKVTQTAAVVDKMKIMIDHPEEYELGSREIKEKLTVMEKSNGSLVTEMRKNTQATEHLCDLFKFQLMHTHQISEESLPKRAG